jgi:hypothetical protein
LVFGVVEPVKFGVPLPLFVRPDNPANEDPRLLDEIGVLGEVTLSRGGIFSFVEYVMVPPDFSYSQFARTPL